MYDLKRHSETRKHKKLEALQTSIVLSEDNQEEIASLKKPVTGEKYFSCTCCNKIFPDLSHLRRHNETKKHKRREALQPSIVLSEDNQEEIASLKHPVTPEKIQPLLADNTAPEVADDLRENNFHEDYELLFSEKNYFTAENLEVPFQDYGEATFPTYSENDFYLTDSLDKQEQKSLYSGNDFYA